MACLGQAVLLADPHGADAKGMGCRVPAAGEEIRPYFGEASADVASYPAEVAWRPWAEGAPAEGGPAAASRGRGGLQILAGAAGAAAWACLLAAVVHPSENTANFSAVILWTAWRLWTVGASTCAHPMLSGHQQPASKTTLICGPPAWNERLQNCSVYLSPTFSYVVL